MIATNIFSTKAQTLDYLCKSLKSAKVLSLYYFTVKEFNNNFEKIYEEVKQALNCNYVIVRSSSINEDGFLKSNAGYYKSVLNVDLNLKENFYNAVLNVIASYEGSLENEVLVQPMLNNIIFAGVSLTVDLDTFAPYYVINFDVSGLSNLITGGNSVLSETYVQFKKSPYISENKYINKLIITLKELEEICNYNFLDIEFAFNNKEELFILQVRPIVMNNKQNLSNINLENLLFKIYSKVEKLNREHPNLLGDRTLFGVMTDWNPAEIIGAKPKKLSLTLYKEFITDNIWAYQRDNYGYRNLRSHPLLVSFLGIPYIDIRVDFNSFIPKNIPDNIAKKLVNYYLNKLGSYPEHHDKVEFNIVYSCFHFSLLNDLTELHINGFNSKEIEIISDALLEITNKIINSKTGFYKNDLAKIEILKNKYDEIIKSDLSVIDKIYWLVEDCKRYGTLPFAGIARSAFIAVQFLNSFVKTGIMSNHDYDKFMSSINTISRQFNFDFNQMKNKSLSKNEFLNIYGHLRPGTYDITTFRYDENFDKYFSCLENFSYKEEKQKFRFSLKQKNEIKKNISKYGLDISVKELILFIKNAIEAREYAKFIFTKSISMILKLIEEIGSRFNIMREDLAFLDIREILHLYSELDHRFVKDIFKENINLNKEYYKYTQAVKLPDLIRDPKDVYGFFLSKEKPNFITQKKVTGKISCGNDIIVKDVKDKIVFINSADPGYDFLFTKGIAGLITKYGGANSHMAIRCAELGIPACIGAGEKNYLSWQKYSILLLNCALNQVIGVV